MTPKEAAENLLEKYKLILCHHLPFAEVEAKDCALYTCQLLIGNTEAADQDHERFWFEQGYTGFKQFWEKVKEEL